MSDTSQRAEGQRCPAFAADAQEDLPCGVLARPASPLWVHVTTEWNAEGILREGPRCDLTPVGWEGRGFSVSRHPHAWAAIANVPIGGEMGNRIGMIYAITGGIVDAFAWARGWNPRTRWPENTAYLREWARKRGYILAVERRQVVEAKDFFGKQPITQAWTPCRIGSGPHLSYGDTWIHFSPELAALVPTYEGLVYTDILLPELFNRYVVEELSPQVLGGISLVHYDYTVYPPFSCPAALVLPEALPQAHLVAIAPLDAFPAVPNLGAVGEFPASTLESLARQYALNDSL